MTARPEPEGRPTHWNPLRDGKRLIMALRQWFLIPRHCRWYVVMALLARCNSAVGRPRGWSLSGALHRLRTWSMQPCCSNRKKSRKGEVRGRKSTKLLHSSLVTDRLDVHPTQAVGTTDVTQKNRPAASDSVRFPYARRITRNAFFFIVRVRARACAWNILPKKKYETSVNRSVIHHARCLLSIEECRIIFDMLTKP